jgi:acetyl esterase/lipase
MNIKHIIIVTLLCGNILQAQQQVISLYQGAAPGSEDWDWNEKVLHLGNTGSGLVYNVSKPTLTVFKPDSVAANGTAIVICPGGGFQFLSMDSEGTEVARWLNKKGYTTFVLKYRLSHSLTDNPMQEFMEKQPNTEKFNKEIEPVVAMAISDGKAAISYLREHADEYGILKDRIGIIGFSAGGTVATGVAYTYDPESRPDFVAPVYPYVGSFDHSTIPANAPPMFILVASDDIFGFNEHCVNLYNDWVKAEKSAELHIYAKGNHGFGMNKKNLPVDTWIERFADWLNMFGF